MKYLFYLFIFFIILSFSSCIRSEYTEPIVSAELHFLTVESITFTITATDDSGIKSIALYQENAIYWDHVASYAFSDTDTTIYTVTITDTARTSYPTFWSSDYKLEVEDIYGNKYEDIIRVNYPGEINEGELLWDLKALDNNSTEIQIFANSSHGIYEISVYFDDSLQKTYKMDVDSSINSIEITDTFDFEINTDISYANRKIEADGIYKMPVTIHAINLTGGFIGSSYYNEYDKDSLILLGTNTSGYNEYWYPKNGGIYVYVPEGDFTMGADSAATIEAPSHSVYLDGYYMSKYEITCAQYKYFCDASGRDVPENPYFEDEYIYKSNYPVINVSWNDAKAYCDFYNMSLPTEAEWEKAARGTDERIYPWGDNSPYYDNMYYANYNPGNYDEDWYYYTAPVGTYPQGISFYGVENIAGNVAEWCYDWFDSTYYEISPYENPQGPDVGEYKVIRGGSWQEDYTYLTTTKRKYDDPTMIRDKTGFRAVYK